MIEISHLSLTKNEKMWHISNPHNIAIEARFHGFFYVTHAGLANGKNLFRLFLQ